MNEFVILPACKISVTTVLLLVPSVSFSLDHDESEIFTTSASERRRNRPGFQFGPCPIGQHQGEVYELCCSSPLIDPSVSSISETHFDLCTSNVLVFLCVLPLTPPFR